MSIIGSIQGLPSALFQRITPDAAAADRDVASQKLPPVTFGGQVNPTEVQAPVEAGETKPVSFSNILEKAVHEVDGKMQAAGVEQEKLLTGETTNLHQSMIAVQEASVAFSLMVEVRNKLVDSYQELMRMQV